MRLTIAFFLFALVFASLGLDNPNHLLAAMPSMTEAVSAPSSFAPGGAQGVRTPETVTAPPGTWPQQATKHTVDVTELKNEAKELSKLANELPAQMDQIGGGKLPKDLIDSLKKIEKLAKHIRGQVS